MSEVKLHKQELPQALSFPAVIIIWGARGQGRGELVSLLQAAAVSSDKIKQNLQQCICLSVHLREHLMHFPTEKHPSLGPGLLAWATKAYFIHPRCEDRTEVRDRLVHGNRGPRLKMGDPEVHSLSPPCFLPAEKALTPLWAGSHVSDSFGVLGKKVRSSHEL